MELDNFIQSLTYCRTKSEMAFLDDFPIVYDEYEAGIIYMDKSGGMWFADKYSRWHETMYNVDMITGIRYKKVHLDPNHPDNTNEADESYIYIYFENGDIIHLTSQNYLSSGIVVTLLISGNRGLSETDLSVIELIDQKETKIKRGLS